MAKAARLCSATRTCQIQAQIQSVLARVYRATQPARVQTQSDFWVGLLPAGTIRMWKTTTSRRGLFFEKVFYGSSSCCVFCVLIGFFPHNTGCGQLNNRYCRNDYELLLNRNRQYFYSWLLNCKQKNSAVGCKFARLVMMFGRRYQSSRPTSAAPGYAKSRRWHRTDVRGNMVRCDSAKASAR